MAATLPPITAPLYLLDNQGYAWLYAVRNDGRDASVVIAPNPPSTVAQVLLQDTVTIQVWALTATSVGTYPNLTVDWNLVSVVGNVAAAPNIITTAPDGYIYSTVVSNGQMVNNLLPVPTGATPISTLATHVQARLEEIGTSGGEFWSTLYELNTAVAEALNDLMILVGRPTQTVNVPYNLNLNTVWQPMPKGLFLITDMRGPHGPVHKVDLHSMDYVQSSWGSAWESDSSPYGPRRWFPVGLSMFAVHPAPTVPMTVSLDGIAYPIQSEWPYDGTQLVPFSDEFFSAIEMYASHICRVKESGAEFQESISLYNNYLQLARRMSEIQDKRDPLIFSPVLGGTAGLRALVKR